MNRRKYRPLPSQSRLKEVCHYDPDTGIFTRLTTFRRWRPGQVMGSIANGYININVDGCIYRAHRLAWVYMTGSEPVAGIDHVNRERSDNRWSNLREADQSENMRNGTARKGQRLGKKGVYEHKGRKKPFQAKIMLHGKSKSIGYYATVDEAKAAFDAAAKVIHGEFARS